MKTQDELAGIAYEAWRGAVEGKLPCWEEVHPITFNWWVSRVAHFMELSWEASLKESEADRWVRMACNGDL
jgi:hypothetical protein